MRRYDDGCTAITNIDFSKPVIKEMMAKNLRARPLMKWQVMDMTQTKARFFDLLRLLSLLAFKSEALGDANCRTSDARAPCGFRRLQAVSMSMLHRAGRQHAARHGGMAIPFSSLHAQFRKGSFEAVVDKGGLDALMGEDTPGSEEAGGKLLAEVVRLLSPAPGSCYLCVTLAQPHVLRAWPPQHLLLQPMHRDVAPCLPAKIALGGCACSHCNISCSVAISEVC